jgi:hypothetical protein
MELDKIEKLIEKYDNGQSTLQEEQALRTYFSQANVAPHLEVYKTMFHYFSLTHEEQFTKDIPLKPRKTIALYKWISVAAIAVLMFGIYFQVNEPAELTDEQLLAYTQTREALDLLSSQFTKGTENINALELMSSSLNKGTENLAYINQFSNTTNKIFKND